MVTSLCKEKLLHGTLSSGLLCYPHGTGQWYSQLEAGHMPACSRIANESGRWHEIRATLPSTELFKQGVSPQPCSLKLSPPASRPPPSSLCLPSLQRPQGSRRSEVLCTNPHPPFTSPLLPTNLELQVPFCHLLLRGTKVTHRTCLVSLKLIVLFFSLLCFLELQ